MSFTTGNIIGEIHWEADQTASEASKVCFWECGILGKTGAEECSRSFTLF